MIHITILTANIEQWEAHVDIASYKADKNCR